MLRSLLVVLSVLSSTAYGEEVKIFSGDVQLAGSFVPVDTPKAAALILPGSGPTDRDGNSLTGLNSDTYKLLAEGLATQNIATLRADKRGLGDSTGDANDVTLSDYADDASKWMDAVLLRSGLNCVWLIGHSEGGLIAMMTTLARDDVCGMVLLAAPGRGLDEILIEQLSAVPEIAAQMDAVRYFLEKLKAGQTIGDTDIPDVMANILPRAVHGFIGDAMRFDPIAAAGQIAIPVLIIQGDRDLQTKPVDATNLDRAFTTSRMVRFPDMAHMLKSTRDPSIEANLETYSNPNLALTSGLIDAIANFMLAPR